MKSMVVPEKQAVSRRYGTRAGLALLTCINLVNYLDRFVISSLVESIKHSHLRLTDAQLGELMTGFIVVYMVASPIFGALGDRFSRTRLISVGVMLWSLASAAAGLAGSFWSLFFARAAVGVGEAAYGTISPSLLADYSLPVKRGRVFAIFYAAIPIGSALGFILGGIIDVRWGWRAAFLMTGIPGLILAGLCLRLLDPPRGVNDQPGDGGVDVDQGRQAKSQGPSSGKVGLWATYLSLMRHKKYMLTVLGYAAYTFAVGGLAFWMPAFLIRMRGIERQSATVQFGLVVVITGFLGTFIGGWVADWYLRRCSQAYLWVSAIATLGAFPLAAIALWCSSPAIYWPALVLAEVLIFVSTGPINSAIVNMVAPGERATAVAFHIFIIHAFGDVPAPWLIGHLSDLSSLGKAILIVPLAIALSGVIWSWAAKVGSGAKSDSLKNSSDQPLTASLA